MAFSRGPFGIEYNPRPLEEDSGGWGWILVVIALVTVASLAWTIVGRLRSSGDDVPTVQISPPEPPAPQPPHDRTGVRMLQQRTGKPAIAPQAEPGDFFNH